MKLISISDSVHKHLKIYAAEHGNSIKNIAENAITNQISQVAAKSIKIDNDKSIKLNNDEILVTDSQLEKKVTVRPSKISATKLPFGEHVRIIDKKKLTMKKPRAADLSKSILFE